MAPLFTLPFQPSLEYGKTRNSILKFTSFEEFYETLGFIANQKRTEIFWEHNEETGAWGSEGRVHCMRDLALFSMAMQNKFTEGIGNVLKRVNCNPFVKSLITDWGFTEFRTPGKSTVRIIPPTVTVIKNKIHDKQYIKDFDKGFNT